MKKKNENCTREKHRSKEEKDFLTKRLNVIEGQIRGLKQMVENDRYCDDILMQISSVEKSLKSLGANIIKGHLNTCVIKDIKENKSEVIDNVIDLFEKLNK